jgi:hypothetical protein
MRIDKHGRKLLEIKTINYIGMAVLIVTMILAVVWYDWKLALLIYMALAGNNLEQRRK